VHVDESRRAIASEFVADQSFPRFYRDSRTHVAGLALMGERLRRVHMLPIPPDAVPSQPRPYLATIWSARPADFTLPRFVAGVVERALVEEPPHSDRALVLCHNDANPSNLVLDGDRIVLLHWDAAAPNDPLYDLAVVSLFLRMDEQTSRQLIAVHDDAPPSPLPPAFLCYRRLTGLMLGTGFLYLARQGGHGGSAAPETLDDVPCRVSVGA
jgi:aminoglycoside phosphotransferase (APT) family kinase protein